MIVKSSSRLSTGKGNRLRNPSSRTHFFALFLRTPFRHIPRYYPTRLFSQSFATFQYAGMTPQCPQIFESLWIMYLVWNGALRAFCGYHSPYLISLPTRFFTHISLNCLSPASFLAIGPKRASLVGNHITSIHFMSRAMHAKWATCMYMSFTNSPVFSFGFHELRVTVA